MKDNANEITRKVPQAPSMDLAPESNDRIDKSWKDPIGAEYCMNDYGDLGRNPCNEPVDERSERATPLNGWYERSENDVKVLLTQTYNHDEDKEID